MWSTHADILQARCELLWDLAAFYQARKQSTLYCSQTELGLLLILEGFDTLGTASLLFRPIFNHDWHHEYGQALSEESYPSSSFGIYCPFGAIVWETSKNRCVRPAISDVLGITYGCVT